VPRTPVATPVSAYLEAASFVLNKLRAQYNRVVKGGAANSNYSAEKLLREENERVRACVRVAARHAQRGPI